MFLFHPFAHFLLVRSCCVLLVFVVFQRVDEGLDFVIFLADSFLLIKEFDVQTQSIFLLFCVCALVKSESSMFLSKGVWVSQLAGCSAMSQK